VAGVVFAGDYVVFCMAGVVTEQPLIRGLKIRHEGDLYFFEQVTIQVLDELLCDPRWVRTTIGGYMPRFIEAYVTLCGTSVQVACLHGWKRRMAVEFLGYSTT
jgi:hypothetical protein